MKILKDIFKKIVILIVVFSILLTFLSTPASYAKLDLKEGEFYYSGTTKGQYTVKQGIFEWLLSLIGDIADWLLGIMTLGIRMVIIGWTALAEKLLTWSLETTSGVNVSGEEVSNDLSSVSDSSNNLTVEAIVYNQVAALDINIFNLETNKEYSGTGKKLVCQECGKPASECVNESTLNEDDVKNGKFDNICGGNSECDCKGCDDCTIYAQQLVVEEPIIVKIKKAVATWYNIIRLLAMSAMLVVLIFVGIKMAISTIASDKAVYKRMLVDWLVGMIMMFALNYFMLFVISMTGTLVDVIRESANEMNQVQMKQLSKSDSEISGSQIEIKVYEEVRSRAYDAKLSNGLIGMIMYMTLVYFAFRYTIVYIKRLLTIIVLTLMSPGIGVAYAMQKALSGKSRALTVWMKEYIMNSLIQVVHALIYALFISEALVLSLESISGMILALILMNYSLKADKLFKKIFNFGGADSLVGRTENAEESLKDSLRNATNLAVGAKPLVNALTNNPYGKAVKGIGKGALAGAVGVAHLMTKNNRDNNENYEEDDGDSNDGNSQTFTSRNGSSDSSASSGSSEGGSADSNSNSDSDESNAQDAEMGETLSDEELLAKGGTELSEDVENARREMEDAKGNPSPETERKYVQAVLNHGRFQRLMTPTNKQIVKAHVNRLLSMEDVFATKNSSKIANMKLEKLSKSNPKLAGAIKGVGKALGTAGRATFGTIHYDRRTGKFVNEGNAVYNQFSGSNLLGLTDNDKKMLKDLAKTGFGGIAGMASFGVGLATVVAHPKIGFGLMVGGGSAYRKAFGKRPNMALKAKKFNFSRFDTSALDSIRDSALARFQFEKNAMFLTDMNQKHPELVRKMANGEVKPNTLESTKFGILPVADLSMGSQSRSRFIARTNLGAKLDEIEKQATKEINRHVNQFYADMEDEKLSSILASVDYRNSKLDNLYDSQTTAGDFQAEERENLLKAMRTLKKGGSIDDMNLSEEEKNKLKILIGISINTENQDNSTGDSELKNNPNTDITESDINKGEQSPDLKVNMDIVNKEMFNIVVKMAGGKELDMNQKNQNQALDMLTTTLRDLGIIPKDKRIESVFTKDSLKRSLKSKTADLNKQLKIKNDEQETNSEPLSEEVEAQINDMAEKRANKRANKEKNERKKKLQEALEMIIGDDDVTITNQDTKTTHRTSEELLQGLLSQKGAKTIENGEKTISLSSEEADYINGTVKDLLKMKALNDESSKRRTSKIKSGGRDFAEATAKKAEITIDLYTLEKQKQQSSRPEERDDLDKQINQKRKELEKSKENLKRKGPVIDVDSYIQNSLFKE